MPFLSLGPSAEGAISFSVGGLGVYARPEPSHINIIPCYYEFVNHFMLSSLFFALYGFFLYSARHSRQYSFCHCHRLKSDINFRSVFFDGSLSDVSYSDILDCQQPMACAMDC